jgi:hypothetical protein
MIAYNVDGFLCLEVDKIEKVDILEASLSYAIFIIILNVSGVLTKTVLTI